MPDRRPVEFRPAANSFDAAWYRNAYTDVDSGSAGTTTAVGHYVGTGADEGRRPNRDFEPDWYLQRYPGVSRSIAKGRLTGPFHDFLLRDEQGVPRRAAPSTAVVAAALAGVEGSLIAALARLTDRAPGWEFWLLAPPGCLPAERFGPHVRLVASAAELPPIDLWLGLREGDAVGEVGTSVPLPQLLDTPGVDIAALDWVLERLRDRLLADCPIVPTARRDSGPIHVDPARAAAIDLTLRPMSGKTPGPGAVLRSADRALADLTVGTTAVDLAGATGLWLDLAAGLAADFSPRDATQEPVDLIICGRGGRAAWERSLRAALSLPRTGNLILVAPPQGVGIPDNADVALSRAGAIAALSGPALLVPPGTALLPHALAQAAACLRNGVGRATLRPAIRHPDGHLAFPGPESLAHDREHAGRWQRAGVTLLCPSARRVWPAARTPPAATAPITEIDVSTWPTALSVLPALAPDWLRLDCRPDGTVIGRFRLQGAGLAAGGTVLIEATTAGLLAEPCPVQAVWRRPSGRDVALGRLTLPASGRFTWRIPLPPAWRSSATLTIAPVGRWITAHGSVDPRPVLFRVEAVRYRPAAVASSRPSAERRAR